MTEVVFSEVYDFTDVGSLREWLNLFERTDLTAISFTEPLQFRFETVRLDGGVEVSGIQVLSSHIPTYSDAPVQPWWLNSWETLETVDLSGPDGGASSLIARAQSYAKMLGYTVEQRKTLYETMSSAEYPAMVAIFEEHFRNYVDLINLTTNDEAE